MAVSEGEGIGGVANRLPMMAGFEFGVLRPLLEEIRECGIEIAERLLQNDRTDLGKKGFLRLPLPLGEFQCGVTVARGFLFLSPGGGAKLQRAVVDIAGAAEGAGQLRCLPTSWEEPVFECLLDYHYAPSRRC